MVFSAEILNLHYFKFTLPQTLHGNVSNKLFEAGSASQKGLEVEELVMESYRTETGSLDQLAQACQDASCTCLRLIKPGTTEYF